MLLSSLQHSSSLKNNLCVCPGCTVATGEGASSTFFSILAVWGVGRATGLGLQLHQSLVFSRGLAHNRSSINAYGMDADVSRLSVEA